MDQQCFPIQPSHWLTELWSTPEYDTVNDSNSSGVWNACLFQIDDEPWHFEPRHHPDRHTHIFLQACMEGCAYVCVYMCRSDRLCYGKQLVKLGQLWQRVNVYDYVGRYFDQASQIHITSSSVVIQLLVYDVHVEVKVEKWLLTPNIHTRIISCLSITTQTILKAKWCTQTSGLQVMLFSNATSYRPNFYRVAWICGWWGHLVLRSRRRRTWTKILNVWQDVTRRQNLQNIVHYRYWAFMFVDFCALWGAFAWQSGWCSPGNGKWNRLYETCLKRAILIDE